MDVKKNHVLDHIRNPAFRDREATDAIWLPEPKRLYLMAERLSGGWSRVAKEIVQRADQRMCWFPDTNVAIRDDAEPVWDAFRLAAMHAREPVAVIGAPVYQELSGWLEDPYRNKARARALRDALSQSEATWAFGFDLDRDRDQLVFESFYSYIRLFGVRRALAVSTVDGSSPVGAVSDSMADTMNAIKDNVGTRAQALARKGRKDFEERGAFNINDEALVVLAIAYALGTGVETAIVTTDSDYLEIFYKAQWFLDTHFRSWLTGEWVANGLLGQSTGEHSSELFFEGPIRLYKKPSLTMEEVLPVTFSPIPVHVLFVSPCGDVIRFGFLFERGMVEMIKIRGQTGGRCTDRFGEANVHIDLAPLGDGFGEFIGVGKDVAAELEGTTMSVSFLDFTHAINCQERLQFLGSQGNV